MDKDFKIYVHISPNNKLYIGQTCQDLTNRSRNGLGYKDSPLFWNAICKYGWDNFKHIVLIDHLNLEQANICEEYLIKKYKTNNRKYGYNIAKGGFNTLHNEETLKKISNSNKGKYVSEETKKKLSQSHKGKYVENCKNKKRRVCQYTIDGMLIKIFGSIIEASYNVGISDSNIINVCKHVNYTAGGYIWAYEGEEPVMNYQRKKNKYENRYHPSAKKVIQYSKEMKYIESYFSALDASHKTNIDSSDISKVCRRERKTAGGYIWRYADEKGEYNGKDISLNGLS